MSEMTEIERRCVVAALDTGQCIEVSSQRISAIVRAVLAEAGVAELVEALRDASLTICFNTCERPGKPDAKHSNVCARTTAALVKIGATQ